MEDKMNKKIIEHKHTLDNKIFVLLVLLIIGVFAKEFGNILAPNAMAQLNNGNIIYLKHSGFIKDKQF